MGRTSIQNFIFQWTQKKTMMTKDGQSVPHVYPELISQMDMRVMVLEYTSGAVF